MNCVVECKIIPRGELERRRHADRGKREFGKTTLGLSSDCGTFGITSRGKQEE